MIDKNLLEQIKQRTDKLIEEQDKLQHMEFGYHLLFVQQNPNHFNEWFFLHQGD